VVGLAANVNGSGQLSVEPPSTLLATIEAFPVASNVTEKDWHTAVGAIASGGHWPIACWVVRPSIILVNTNRPIQWDFLPRTRSKVMVEEIVLCEKLVVEAKRELAVGFI
jgi:hypothetical protein